MRLLLSLALAAGCFLAHARTGTPGAAAAQQQKALGKAEYKKRLEKILRRIKLAKTVAQKQAAEAELKAFLEEPVPSEHEGWTSPSIARFQSLKTWEKSIRDERGKADSAKIGARFDGSQPSSRLSSDFFAYSEGFGGEVLPKPAKASLSVQRLLKRVGPDQRTAALQALPKIDAWGRKTGVYERLRRAGVRDPQVFILSQALHESGFASHKISPAGAVGFMQVMPETAKWHGVNGSLHDLDNNLEAGMEHMAYALKELKRVDHALFGYNAGVPRVQKVLGSKGRLPRIRESRDYVARIMGSYTKATGQALYDSQRSYASTASAR
jgi:hypothetical protein